MQKQAVYKNAVLDITTGVEIGKPDNWLIKLYHRIAGKERAGITAKISPALLDYGDMLFLRACEDPSNIEMDWQWLYTQVQRADQKRFCLQRALYINPTSEFARKELRKMKF